MAINTESTSVPEWGKVTSTGVESYAIRHNRLHPTVREFLQPLFPRLDLASVRLVVYPQNTSFLGTSVWVWGEKIVFEQGHLNEEHAQWRVDRGDGITRYTTNGAIDLATISGMLVLCHELRHVWQSRSLPWWKKWWRYSWGVAKSIFKEWRLYSHEQVWQEIDAIEFQNGVARAYVHSGRDRLKEFASIR